MGMISKAGGQLSSGRGAVSILVACVALFWSATAARGYIEVPYSLGRVVQEATTITVLRVEKVDRVKNTITYSKVEDLRGKSPEVVKHNIAQAGFQPREWQNIMAWVQEGKIAVFFHNGAASETCIESYWYQCYPGGEWWNMYHAEPYLLRSYAGKAEKLIPAVKSILAGEEVVVTAMVDGDKNSLQLRQARVQRLKASLKLQDYSAGRDFVGWGGEEIRPVSDMAGFTYVSVLPQVGGSGACGMLPVHLESENKTDLLMYSEARMVLLQNAGSGSFNEVPLPVATGARGSAWCDYNGMGRPSLLLATPLGPKLLTNLGGLKFRDDSAGLPQLPYWHLTAAAWVTLDGAPAMVLADAFSGLRVLRNRTPKAAAGAAAGVAAGPVFEDVSEAVGLGAHGLGSDVKVVALNVGALVEDGKQDLLVIGTTRGVILRLVEGKFRYVPTLGLAWGECDGAAVGDLLGRKKLDLAIVDRGVLRVLANGGRGGFAEVALARNGALGRPASSVALAARSNAGGEAQACDLVLGATNGSNSYLRNDGRGGWTDATEEVGLDRRIFNTRAVMAMPVPAGSAATDLFMINENQDSVLLMARKP